MGEENQRTLIRRGTTQSHEDAADHAPHSVFIEEKEKNNSLFDLCVMCESVESKSRVVFAHVFVIPGIIFNPLLSNSSHHFNYG